MKILAIDSSGLVASVALLENDVLIAEYTIDYKKTHSQTLLPMLDEVKKMTELDLKTIDAVAVAAGPGSFTGLRIGSATAKGLAYALNKPIVSIPTTEALAFNLYGSDKLVCPIMDARRNQVYTGVYEYTSRDGNVRMNTIKECEPMNIEDLVNYLKQTDQEVIFLGDGVEVYGKALANQLGSKVSFAPAHLCRQKAGSVAALGKIYYEAGRVQTAEEHAPEYYRLSQAERERKENGACD